MINVDSYLIDLERIATPREDLLTFQAGIIDSSRLEQAIAARYDYAPVLGEQDRLMGIAAVSMIKERYETGIPVGESDTTMFIKQVNDVTPLLEFLDAIAANKAIVIRDTDGNHDPHWFGLVTISDLNRHHFRAHLYPILAGLEASLAALVDQYFPNASDWIRKCSERQQVQHFGQWRVASENGVETSPIVSCTLSDLITILTETPELVRAFGFQNKTRFKDRYGSLSLLRNQVMHPVRPLILGLDDVIRLRERIGAAIELTQTSAVNPFGPIMQQA